MVVDQNTVDVEVVGSVMVIRKPIALHLLHLHLLHQFELGIDMEWLSLIVGLLLGFVIGSLMVFRLSGWKSFYASLSVGRCGDDNGEGDSEDEGSPPPVVENWRND